MRERGVVLAASEPARAACVRFRQTVSSIGDMFPSFQGVFRAGKRRTLMRMLVTFVAEALQFGMAWICLSLWQALTRRRPWSLVALTESQ
jgi:hypothetical protein